VIDRAVDIGREAIVLVHGSETANRELAVLRPRLAQSERLICEGLTAASSTTRSALHT
jgi:hypothetical protein